MKEKEMTNSYIIAVLRMLKDETGTDLLSKRLPAKLLCNLRRSLQEIEAAYKTYSKNADNICKKYGTTPDKMTCDTTENQQALAAEMAELLSSPVCIKVYTVEESVLYECGEKGYDPLTFTDIDRLWWLIDNK